MPITSHALPVLSAEDTAKYLLFTPLCNAISQAATEYAEDLICSPERQVLALNQGGALLSMPATAWDIGIHKLVNVCPANAKRSLPTIHGLVSIYDANTGKPLLILDGPTVTARRTAAVSMLAIQALCPQPPRHIALIGTGGQAAGHLQALAELFPGIQVDIHSHQLSQASAFCHRHAALPLTLQPCDQEIAETVEVVITLTTSRQILYNQPARVNRLLIGVGAFQADMVELGPVPIHGSQLFADDPAGAHQEAGDLIQAQVNWQQVRSLSDALNGQFDPQLPRLFKSVGSAAWDLAAARCALTMISA